MKELHPLCTLFPRIDGKAFNELVADITSNGLREPVVLHDGLILDGGNRARACEVAGIEPDYVEFSGSGGIVSFVLSRNLHRRHLTEGQRAALVASATDWAETNKQGRPEKQIGHVAYLSTQAERAETAGVSLRTQKRAEQVAKADPEKIKEVARGEKTLPQAICEIKPPPIFSQLPNDEVSNYTGPSDDELAEALEMDANDKRILHGVLAGDDPLADALKEIIRLKSELAIVKLARDGYMNQFNEVLKKFKAVRRKLESMK